MIPVKQVFDFSFFNHQLKVSICDAEMKLGLIVLAAPFGYSLPVAAGCLATVISNSLDEYRISSLKERNITYKLFNELPAFVLGSVLYGLSRGWIADQVELVKLGCLICAVGLLFTNDKNHCFFKACQDNDVESAKLLILHHVDINYKNKEGVSSLEAACAKKNQIIVEFLLEQRDLIVSEALKHDEWFSGIYDAFLIKQNAEFQTKLQSWCNEPGVIGILNDLYRIKI